jgi:hypothetical protein
MDRPIKEEKDIQNSKKNNGPNYKSCEYCKKQHKKCDGNSPCNRCKKSGNSCTYLIKTKHTMESLESRVKELEALLQLQEERNHEMNHSFKKALQDLTRESQKVHFVMARASKLWNLSALQFYFQKYDNTLGQVTRLRLPYENPSNYFSDTDEIRIASMSSIMANGALIAGDFRAAEEFFKEARHYANDEFSAQNLAHGMNILVNLSNFAASMGNFDEVQTYLKRIIHLAERHPDVVANATKNFRTKCRRAGIVEDKDIDEDFMIYQSLANAVDWLILFAPEADVANLIAISETKTRLRPTSIFLFILYSLKEISKLALFYLHKNNILELDILTYKLDELLMIILAQQSTSKNYLLCTYCIVKMLCLCAARNHTEASKMLDELLFHAQALLSDCPSYFVAHMTLFSSLPFFYYNNNVAGKESLLKMLLATNLAPLAQFCWNEHDKLLRQQPLSSMFVRIMGGVAGATPEFINFGGPSEEDQAVFDTIVYDTSSGRSGSLTSQSADSGEVYYGNPDAYAYADMQDQYDADAYNSGGRSGMDSDYGVTNESCEEYVSPNNEEYYSPYQSYEPEHVVNLTNRQYYNA